MARFRAVVMTHAPGFVGVPSTRPPFERGREGILHRVLGAIEITEDAGEDSDGTAPFLPEDRANFRQCSITGLSSTDARKATGIRAAIEIASSRSSASRTMTPPICSLVSA